jgi:predicted DNA-binding protein
LGQRIGRPKVDKPKDVQFGIRLDQDLNDKLKEYCDRTGKGRVEVIREGIKLILKLDKK